MARIKHSKKRLVMFKDIPEGSRLMYPTGACIYKKGRWGYIHLEKGYSTYSVHSTKKMILLGISVVRRRVHSKIRKHSKQAEK